MAVVERSPATRARARGAGAGGRLGGSARSPLLARLEHDPCASRCGERIPPPGSASHAKRSPSRPTRSSGGPPPSPSREPPAARRRARSKRSSPRPSRLRAPRRFEDPGAARARAARARRPAADDSTAVSAQPGVNAGGQAAQGLRESLRGTAPPRRPPPRSRPGPGEVRHPAREETGQRRGERGRDVGRRHEVAGLSDRGPAGVVALLADRRGRPP